MVEEESRKEREVRQALEARLDPGEELLAYTRGISYHIGLTAKRLIYLPLKWWGWGGKPSGKVFSIRRESIKSLEWSGLWARMRIGLPQDKMEIRFQGSRWKKRAKELVNLATQAALPPPADMITESQRHLQQARDFQGLGFMAPAQHELSEAIQIDPALSMDPSVASLRKQLVEARLALQVGSVFLFANIGLAILLAALVAIIGGGQAAGEFLMGEGGCLAGSLIIDLIIGVSLWQGRPQYRRLAILRAVLGFIIFGVGALAKGGFLELITQAAFCGSIILVLTGRSNHTRTWVAIGIYAIGYLGLVTLQFLIAIVAGLVGAL